MSLPVFANQTDMIAFIRELPKDADYRGWLLRDFGIKMPDQAEQYESEYTWKYMIQGTHNKVPENELLGYAQKGIDKLIKLMPFLAQGTKSSPEEVTESKRKTEKHPDGAIVFNPKYNKWEAWWGGQVVSRAKKKEKVEENMKTSSRVG